MFIDEAHADALERLCHGADLGEDIDAVRVLIDHALDPAHLAFDPFQACREFVLGI
jgi:hypothetical protein